MSEHLSNVALSALADGELAGEELAYVEAHLAECMECMRRALSESLLKRATQRAGQRYAMPEGLRERVMGAVSSHPSGAWVGHPQAEEGLHSGGGRREEARFAVYGSAMLVAATLLVGVTVFTTRELSLRGAQQAALVNEAVDEHIAAMAAGGPEVVSSDRHTVKPWFQGRLAFSFNLPQELPADVTLDGANLVEVEGQPAAQLLFSIGKHRASVFVSQRAGERAMPRDGERNGFHVEGFHARELDVVGVSDADPARLRDLVQAMESAQE